MVIQLTELGIVVIMTTMLTMECTIHIGVIIDIIITVIIGITIIGIIIIIVTIIIINLITIDEIIPDLQQFVTQRITQVEIMLVLPELFQVEMLEQLAPLVREGRTHQRTRIQK